MLKTVKKILLGSCSILGISLIVWTIALLNPGMSYAHETKIGNLTVFHNQVLDPSAELVIKNALAIISKADIYQSDIEFDFCLNDGAWYPEYHPVSSGLAYSFLNKAVIYACEPNFSENIATSQWEINDYELRKFDLTYLIAHELTHCLQSNKNAWLQFRLKKINWKLEGHADYISRQWQQDQALKSKIDFFLEQEKLELPGIPVITMPDGTKQPFYYYKYALVTQYLLEEENLNFTTFNEDQRTLPEAYAAMLTWHAKN